MLSTDISASSCLTNWVNGVSSSGTFVKHPDMTSLPSGVSGIPTGWTVVNDGEDSPITFYLTDTRSELHQFNIPYSMTWREFIASEYNTVNELGDKSFIDNVTVYYGEIFWEITPDGIEYYTEYLDVHKNGEISTIVFPDEYIREDINYTI
jgi:hypothetical protein